MTIPIDDLVKLNPALQRWTTPANDRGFVLYLPAGTKDLYEQSIASIPPDKRIWWRAHRVVEGETLVEVAKQYRISPVSLAQANQLNAGAALEQGSHLILPMAAGNDASLVRVREPLARQLVHYRVRPGDTVDLIADRYDVTSYQIRRWNGLPSAKLVPGRTLRLYVQAQSHTVTRRAHPQTTAKRKPTAAGTATTRKPLASTSRTSPSAALHVP